VDAQRFKDFVVRHRTVLTTPGVVAEIQGHQRRRLRGEQGGFWALARRQFHELRIDEEAVRLGEMEEGDLTNQGPVDASVLELARRRLVQYRRVAVLTADEPLWERCRNQQIPACWIHEILAGP
jgi:rRNA-processing protein FCF1